MHLVQLLLPYTALLITRTIGSSVLLRIEQSTNPHNGADGEGILLTCPPGFGWPRHRTACLRVFRPSTPVDFYAASWACSLFPGGTLAHMKPSDEDFLSKSMQRDRGLRLTEGDAQRLWIGIHRASHDQPFAFTRTNQTVNTSEYRLAPRSSSAEEEDRIDGGDCVYWDAKAGGGRFAMAPCEDDHRVDGFVCQAVYEIRTFCNTTVMARRSKCAATGLERESEEGCTRAVSRKVHADIYPCALNRTCVLHPPRSQTAASRFPADHIVDDSCTIYCAEDNPTPTRVPCDKIRYETVEPCDCESSSSHDCHPSSESLSTCQGDRTDAEAKYKAYAIAVSFVLILCGLISAVGVVIRRWRLSRKHSRRTVETVAMS